MEASADMRAGRAVVTLLALAITVTATGCDAPCSNEVIADIKSPSGKLRAVVFNRNCGATTGFNTQLSIVSARDPVPSAAGNAFIDGGSAPLAIQWLSETELSVSGTRGMKTFKQEKHVAGVAIRYR